MNVFTEFGVVGVVLELKDPMPNVGVDVKL